MMSTGGKKKPRTPRVAPLELAPGRMKTLVADLQRPEVMSRLAMCLAAVIVMWLLVSGWAPSFGYRKGFIPVRDIDARVAFKEKDPVATQQARQRALSQVPYVYRQDPSRLEQLRASLLTQVKQILDAPTFSDLGPEAWRQFVPPAGEATQAVASEEEQFESFREALSAPNALLEFEQGIAKAFEPIERYGLIEKLPEQHAEDNQKEISVYVVGRPQSTSNVPINNVLMSEAVAQLKKNLQLNLKSPAVAEHVFAWLRPRLMSTLTLDEVATAQAREKALESVEDEYNHYQVGQVLAKSSTPIGDEELRLLRLEHEAWLNSRSWNVVFYRSLAVFSLIVATCALCGYFIFQYERPMVADLRRMATLLFVVVGTVAIARWTMTDPWHAELAPLVIFGMTCGVCLSRELALLMVVALATILVTAGGHTLGEFLVLVGVGVCAVLMLGRIRSRTRFVTIGLFASVAAFILTLASCVLDSQPMNWEVLNRSGWNALLTFSAGFAMTGLLPFIESRFGVLTELRLLEFGDVSHPLLQELVRRAPGTYNHSINVASIAEAAAEAIGAQGLLVRVGAYFHDIGKMLKPSYFVENQGPGVNRHEGLMPAMSTLIIIAHIKDGADLARQHKLPQPIIDFIEQHHGTTLVEYFFRRASEQKEANPDFGEVEENAFRYPGPKPQTKEAAVLMLADAAESASRALVEPTPARLENLVEELAHKRLLDGQFDECDLNLRELRIIQDSLIKSLTAVYHGRVKYPDQRTA